MPLGVHGPRYHVPIWPSNTVADRFESQELYNENANPVLVEIVMKKYRDSEVA